jgi:putative transposase
VLVREELDRLLDGGADEGTNIISALVDIVTRLVVQQPLEGEQADFLCGRGRYRPRVEDQRGSRNGYEPARIRTAEGAIGVRVPQVRGAGEPFRSSLMTFLDGNSDVLDRLVTEMYARGLSTRDVEDAFRDATGELLISRSAVSEITNQLWEDYQAFIARDLSDIDVEYLFADAIFEYRVPVRHRIRVRTTNLAERGFEEERRRTKVIPRLMTERATMKLAFATMIRAAERWCRVSINDLERHQLTLLRAELGLDPPPTEDHATRTRRTSQRAAA